MADPVRTERVLRGVKALLDKEFDPSYQALGPIRIEKGIDKLTKRPWVKVYAYDAEPPIFIDSSPTGKRITVYRDGKKLEVCDGA